MEIASIRLTPAGAHSFRRSSKLLNGNVGRRHDFGTVSQTHQRNPLFANASGPFERAALARIFSERLAIGGDRVLELRNPAFPLAEDSQVVAEIVPHPRPH